ncbi:MAG TPA: hypothetical protein VLA05_05685, partial [Coriobacteriia bacterium]|nr:hypothetical protein [Coriobacteriia bacterium]
MSKAMRITVLALALVCMFALVATNAYAYSGYWRECGACHSTAPTAATIGLNAGTNNGTTAQYGITTGGGATEWAVFAGYTKLFAGSGATTVTVPAGATYSVYAVGGSPSAGASKVSNVTPADTYVDVPGDVTPPVTSSNAVATYANSATVRMTATDAESGVEFIYFTVNGGATRTTPVGTSGYAEAFLRPASEGTFNYTIEFWAQDRNGNIEDPAQSASFSITRAGAAYTGATPQTTLGTNGMSQWSYQDLADNNAKYEGGYAAFGATSGYYADPHGGYDTATNKCKVCHAVHRAEGAYYLLRADSQDDACDYCHIGGSAHSSKVVYDLNSAGKATTNGHTIGASTYIPDSTVAQWTEAVTLSTVDANGDPLTEDIEVRAYDEQKNDMYRFARHHGHSMANGGNRRNYVPVGPLALRCMSCHQVHNAEAQTWNSISMASRGEAGQYNAHTTSSYKLLKQFPSGTYVGGLDTRGQIPLGQISIVPETTLTAGVNFDA